ncbi:MAG: FdhF/YdeP family oxidoreductase [Actinomycetota bacterium]|nr:FdhF/YdeP family oxidoreductase [Actinomycetota bacterium]
MSTEEDRRGDDPVVGEPKTTAAGAPGVAVAMRHAMRQMGARRTVATLRHVNQVDGFDCPGCAWPEPHDRSMAEFCENGVKAVAEEATRARVDRSFFAEHTIADLAERDDHWLGQQGRLTEPVVKRPGADRYEPIGWDEALDLVASELRALADPDEAVFYTSGRTSNEAAFVYQLFARAFGTNNLPDCSNMCHESSGAALNETLGIGKGTVTLDDITHTDLLIVVGQNPGTNHPRMLTALEEAKRNGARIVAVNPLPEAGLLRFDNPQKVRGLVGQGTDLADLFLQVRSNGDLALFSAINARLLERDAASGGTVLDHEFIAQHCDGFDEYAASLEKLSWDDVDEATGLDRSEIDAAVDLVVGADRIIVCWAMGLTQHRNSVATIREVVNFLLLRGNMGRPGAGACPVRGHSNVQGDRTMGIYEKPSEALLDALAAEFGFEPPRDHGVDTVDAIRAMADGRARTFFAVGGNFVSAAPDTDVVRAALERCRLTVNVSTKLNRSHTACGEISLILPCLGRTEADVRAAGPQRVTVEDSMGVVHASHGRLDPASEHLRSEVAILSELAERTVGERVTIDWPAMRDDYAVIRSHISRVIPGFDDMERRIAEPGGFVLPNPPRDERRFATATGSARFTVNPLEVLAIPADQLLLQTLRSHDQYNTTIYGLDDRYRGIKGGRRVVFVSPTDLGALGLADGDVVDLVSRYEGVERRAAGFRVVAYPIAARTCAAYFPEANPVVPLDSTAEVSNTPTSKSVVVSLERR